MPIYPPRTPPFNCAICGVARPAYWTDPRHQDYPPLCFRCEQYQPYRQGPITINPDRRIAKQIAVLAQEIADEAHRQTHGGFYGRA